MDWTETTRAAPIKILLNNGHWSWYHPRRKWRHLLFPVAYHFEFCYPRRHVLPVICSLNSKAFRPLLPIGGLAFFFVYQHNLTSLFWLAMQDCDAVERVGIEAHVPADSETATVERHRGSRTISVSRCTLECFHVRVLCKVYKSKVWAILSAVFSKSSAIVLWQLWLNGACEISVFLLITANRKPCPQFLIFWPRMTFE